MSIFKKNISAIVAFILLLVGLGVFFTGILKPFEVQGLSQEKVQEISEGGYALLQFTRPINKSHFKKVISLDPKIAYALEWEGGKKVKIIPQEKIGIGKNLSLSFNEPIRDILGNEMKKELKIKYIIIDSPQVVLALPKGETEVENKIVVTFNRPMIELTSLDEDDTREMPMKIEPKIEGKYRWLGTSAIEFIPKDRFKYSTKYKVTIDGDIKDLSGGKLGEDFIFDFETPNAILKKAETELKIGEESLEYDLQKYKFMYGKNSILLHFNQDIDLEDLKSRINIYKENEEDLKLGRKEKETYNLEVYSQAEESLRKYKINPDEKMEGETVPLNLSYLNDEEGLHKNIIKIYSNEDWKKDMKYELVLFADIKSLEGDLKENEDESYSILFSGAPELSVLNFSPEGELSNKDRYNSSTNIEINFSVPMNNEKFAKFISIEPKADIFTDNEYVYLDYYNTHYRGWWDLKPSTKYTVTISKDINDLFGRKLGKDFSWSFTTAPMAPNIYLEQKAGEFGVFESETPPMYRLKYVNIKKVHVELAKLNIEDVIDIQNKKSDYSFSPSPSNYELLANYNFDIPKNTNEITTQNLEIAKYFKEEDKRFKSGIFLLDVWSPEVIDYNGTIVHNQHIFVLTPYALTLKYDRENAFIFASDLKTGKPVEKLGLSFISLDNKTQYKALTDENGMTSIKIDLKKFIGANQGRYDFFIKGEKDGYSTFISSNWSDDIDPWKFNLRENYIEPNNSPNEIKGNIYTDRPIYKPGETVYFKGILRDFNQTNFTIPKGKKVKFIARDNDYNEVFNKEYEVSDFGGFDGEFKIPENVKYGNFQLEGSINLNDNRDEWRKSIYGNIWVTHFQKAPFKLDVTLPQEEYFWGDTVKGTITAETFYGVRLANQKVNLSVSSTDYYFNRFDEEGYSFANYGDWCWYWCNGSNYNVLSEEKTLDNKGSADFSFEIKTKEDESAPPKVSQVYTVQTTVWDSKSNKEVSGRKEFIAHMTDTYLGIKSENYMIYAQDEAEFKFVSLNPDGTKKSNIKAKATLIKREYKTIRRKNVDGEFYYENETKDTEITSKNVKTNYEGKGTSSFKIDTGGNYIIRISNKDSQGREVSAETGIWVSSREIISWPRANHDRIEIIADKQEYKVGDTAKVMIKSPYTNVNALITTEQDRLLTKRLEKIESNAQIIEIPITEEHIPNVYVSVVLLKGRTSSGQYDKNNNRDTGQPEFKIGYIKLPVSISQKSLAITVKTSKERYVPQEEVTIDVDVKDIEGKGIEADLAVMVVDMSLLALTGYEKPDVLSVFYGERGLGVKTALTMAKFIERFKPGAKGGGGGDEKKARGEFKNTAYWIGSLKTDKSGKASTKFNLPDNLTEWKVTVIAQDKLNRFGSGDSEFMETKRLIIDPSLPQFFNVKDEAEIKTVISNRQEKKINAKVSLLLENGTILSSDSKNISINPDERETVIFKVKAEEEGEMKFTFNVKSEEAEDTLIETRRINRLTTEEVVATSGLYEETAKEAIYIPKEIISDMGQIDISLSPTLAHLLPKNLKLLKSYPYECSEQTISKIFPNTLILRNKLLEKLFPEEEKKQINDMISSGLSKIYSEQNIDGSWGYFVSSTEYRDYLTAYITIALEEMNNSGYEINKDTLKKARKYLNNSKNTNDLISQGFIRWALSYSSWTESDKEYAKRVVSENKETLPYFAQIYWALYGRDITLLENPLEAAEHTDRGTFFEEKKDIYSQYWSTAKRTTALTLYALEKLEPEHPYIRKILRWLNNNRNHQGYGNTQENIWTLLALIRHAENEKLENLNNIAIIRMENEEIMKSTFNSENPFKVDQKNIEIKDLEKEENIYFDLTKQGTGRINYDINMSYFIPAEHVKAREEGFSIMRELYTLDGVKLDSIPKVGEIFKVKLIVVAPKEGNFIAVEDFVPAGIVPINTAFSTERNDLDESLINEGDRWWKWGVLNYFRHEEFRDDRVFLFAEWLPAGVYEYEYAARVTHKGSFSHLPARVFEMYDEDRFGRTKGDRVVIH